MNEKNEEIYSGTKHISSNDFDNYTNKTVGEQYLANVRIPSSEIASGKSASGKVYFTVYKENELQFDEVSCDALYCLPTKDVQVTFDEFPLELRVKDIMGSTSSIIQIQGADYEFVNDYSPRLNITIMGEKINDIENSGYDIIDYKLLDSDGYMIKSGSIILSSLSEGDKFKDSSVVIYDVVPGESYLFQLLEYNW